MQEENITAWERVKLARMPARPTALEYIEEIFDEFIEFSGDRKYKDDKSIVGGIALLGKQAYTIIAQQKGRNTKENIERNFRNAKSRSIQKITKINETS